MIQVKNIVGLNEALLTLIDIQILNTYTTKISMLS